ncbi:MAG TPA: hypothetical protein VK762_18665 [Polyangiaceae bacterium]|jgi:hypothetical protein|nr:hypothetical protein [Polyangiaceae bacterium]
MRPALSDATIDRLARALASTEPSPSSLARRHALRAKTARNAAAKTDGERDSKAPEKVIAKRDVGR